MAFHYVPFCLSFPHAGFNHISPEQDGGIMDKPSALHVTVSTNEDIGGPLYHQDLPEEHIGPVGSVSVEAGDVQVLETTRNIGDGGNQNEKEVIVDEDGNNGEIRGTYSLHRSPNALVEEVNTGQLEVKQEDGNGDGQESNKRMTDNGHHHTFGNFTDTVKSERFHEWFHESNSPHVVSDTPTLTIKTRPLLDHKPAVEHPKHTAYSEMEMMDTGADVAEDYYNRIEVSDYYEDATSKGMVKMLSNVSGGKNMKYLL